jgi:transcriptional regulator with XRE-family HTH domain
LQNKGLLCHVRDVPAKDHDPEVVAVQRILATNLLAARTSARLSQDELGQKSGLGRAYIYRVEKAEANLTLASLTSLATSLGVSPWQLIAPTGLETGTEISPQPQQQPSESVGSKSSPSADYLAIELPAGSAFEAARVVSTLMNRPIPLVDPVTRIVSGIASGARKGSA